MQRTVAAILAILGWASLVLQFVLAMTNPIVPEPSTLERFVRFFSYFTISTNIIVALTLSAIAFVPNSRLGQFFSRSSTLAAVASYISVVGIVYSLFLRSVWDPSGWQAVADHALHDAMPLLFVLYWVIFAPKTGIRLTDTFRWMIYPIVYLAYSLGRGAIVNWYPYWFADVTALGYPTALTNSGLVLVGFFVIGLIYFALSKLLVRGTPMVAA